MVFLTAILLSLLPDLYPKLFGDWFCQGQIGQDVHGCLYGASGKYSEHNAIFHWGYRHWLFFAMGLCLFAFHVYRIVLLINKGEPKS